MFGRRGFCPKTEHQFCKHIELSRILVFPQCMLGKSFHGMILHCFFDYMKHQTQPMSGICTLLTLKYQILENIDGYNLDQWTFLRKGKESERNFYGRFLIKKSICESSLRVFDNLR